MNKNIIITVLLILLGGIVFFTCNCRKPVKPVFIPVKDQAKKVDDKVAQFKPVIDSLVFEIKKRDAALSVSQRALDISQEKFKVAVVTIQKLKSSSAPKDTSAKGWTDYYTRENAIEDAIKSAKESDSICNANKAKTDSQFVAQKAIISSQDSVIAVFRTGLDVSFDQQKKKDQYIGKLEKKARWSNVGKLVWKGIAVTAVVYTAISLIAK